MRHFFISMAPNIEQTRSRKHTYTHPFTFYTTVFFIISEVIAVWTLIPWHILHSIFHFCTHTYTLSVSLTVCQFFYVCLYTHCKWKKERGEQTSERVRPSKMIMTFCLFRKKKVDIENALTSFWNENPVLIWILLMLKKLILKIHRSITNAHTGFLFFYSEHC